MFQNVSKGISRNSHVLFDSGTSAHCMMTLIVDSFSVVRYVRQTPQLLTKEPGPALEGRCSEIGLGVLSLVPFPGERERKCRK